jgi:hypothetical protein
MAITRKDEAQYRHYQPERVEVIDGRAVRFNDVCVHTFNVGDVEDPDIYAGEPLWQWQQSEAGQWVMANAVETPYWISSLDHFTWGNTYKIMARLSEQNQTYFKLKFTK